MDPDKRLLPLLFLSFLIGVTFALYPYVSWVIGLLAFFALGFLYYRVFLRSQKVGKRQILIIVLFFLLFSYGFIALKKPTTNSLQSLAGKEIIVNGTIVEHPIHYSNQSRFYVKTQGSRILVKLYSPSEKTIDALCLGSQIKCKATVEDLRKFLKPMETIDLYKKRNDIAGMVKLESKDILKLQPPKNIFLQWMHRVRQKAFHNLKIATRGNATLLQLLSAIVLNHKSDVPRESYAEIGLSHLLSISGLHFSLLSLLFLLCLCWLPIKPYGRVVLLQLFMFFYLFLIGFPIPAMRAYMMVTIFSLSFFVRRQSDPFHTLLLAGFVILLLSPYYVLQVSFWFSFSCTAALCLPGSWMQKSGVLYLVSSLMSYVSFHMISFVSVFSNAVFGLFLAPFFLWGVVSIVIPGISSVILYPVMNMLFEGLQFIGKTFHAIPGSYRYISSDMQNIIICLLVGAFLLAICAYYDQYRPFWKKTIGSVLCLSLLLLFLPLPSSTARITYFQVGEGDSILLEFDQNIVLIDAGEKASDSGYLPVKNSVIPYLKKRGINHLQTILLSHYHSDHYGGIPYILEHVPNVDMLLIPATQSADQKEFVKYMQKNAPFYPYIEKVQNEQICHFSTISSLRIVPMYKYLSLSRDENENNQSIITIFTYGKRRFLFTGDIESEAEKVAIQMLGNDLQADVLKVPHHGSNTSSTEDFLKWVQPTLSIISCGEYTRFRHPSQEVIQRLQNVKSRVLTTRNEGTIVLETDGIRIWEVED
jgi:competence protein ComEC